MDPENPRAVAGSNSDTPANDQLLAYIERIERMEEEKKQIGEDIKEIYAEAKGTGFEVKIIRKIVALRKVDKDQIREEKEILDLYLNSIGMGGIFG